MHLERLIQVLKDYTAMQKDVNDTKDANKIQDYFVENKEGIINDYHHIIDHHLNEDNISKLKSDQAFRHIYNSVMAQKSELECDINQCMMFKRNHSHREDDNKRSDIKRNVGMNLLDSIHSYFIHSVDTGARLIGGELKHDDEESKGKRSDCFDVELNRLRAYLSQKAQKLIEIRGHQRVTNNKFLTKVDNKQTDDIG